MVPINDFFDFQIIIRGSMGVNGAAMPAYRHVRNSRLSAYWKPWRVLFVNKIRIFIYGLVIIPHNKWLGSSSSPKKNNYITQPNQGGKKNPHSFVGSGSSKRPICGRAPVASVNRPSEAILPLKANSPSIQQAFPKTRKIDASIRKKYYTTQPEKNVEIHLYVYIYIHYIYMIYFWFFCVCVFFLLRKKCPKLSEYETLQGFKSMPPIPVFLLGPRKLLASRKSISGPKGGWEGVGSVGVSFKDVCIYIYTYIIRILMVHKDPYHGLSKWLEP